MRLAVFDCDGTLIDSCANIVAAMRAAFAARGRPAPPDEAVRHVVGLSLAEAMRELLPDDEATEHLALADLYAQAFQDLRATRRLDPEPLYPGIAALLDRLDGAGWLMALATGKSDRGLRLALQAHGLAGRFVSLQTASRHPSKPHPAMLEAALGETGAAPADSFIVGDTAWDMGMGRAAGVPAIGVAWGYHAPQRLLQAGARAVAADAQALENLLHEHA